MTSKPTSLSDPVEVDRVSWLKERHRAGHKPPGLLIDGDLLLYSTLSGLEEDTRWTKELHTLHVNPVEARDLVFKRLSRLSGMYGTERVMVLFTGTGSWRKEIDPSYKLTRVTTRKPLGYTALRDEIVEGDNYRTLMRPRVEADDLAGVLATDPRYAGGVVIWSGDKDWLQLPGYHHRQGDDRLYFQTPQKGTFFLAKQALVGDKADNYPGCRGIGDVSAEKILAAAVAYSSDWPAQDDVERVLWTAVVEAFAKTKEPATAARHQWRLARLLRTGDYDFKSGEVRLWEPPVPIEDPDEQETKGEEG